jgi:hypothetical protein
MDETKCAECESKLLQCFSCKKVDDDTRKALKASTKKKKKGPRVPSQSEVKQDHFLQIMRKQFLISDIDRDGHCCFNAFSAVYWKVSGSKLSQKDLRKRVSQYLLSSDGQVPGLLYQQFEKLADGRIMSCQAAELQNFRNSRIKAPMTLQEYCAKVEKDLYGGDLEIAVLAHVFNVQIQVYSWLMYHESDIFAPELYGDFTATQRVAMLWTQNFNDEEGGQDHYDAVYLDYHAKWRHYMFTMPEWTVDIGPCDSEGRGRGVKALRAFKKGDVLLFYDGHRVDFEGHVVFERQAVKRLFHKHTFDPASIEFKRTHAVGLGRLTHSIGVLIDGYPLTLPIFDGEPCIGRGAQANSASPQESNMKMEWHDAPDLPLDLVDKIRNKEAFLVATRDIEYESCLS